MNKRRTKRTGNVGAPLPAEVLIPLLRVLKALGGPRGLPPIDEESWWEEVLHDARARWPSDNRLPSGGRHAHLRLDRCRVPQIVLHCGLCGIRREYETAELTRRYGGDFNMVVLRYKLVRCRARSRDAEYGPCHLRYEHW